MGWTYTSKPYNVKEWAAKGLTWENNGKRTKCLDVALVGFEELYAAVETIFPDGRRTVWAAVYNIKYIRSADRYSSERFGYRDETEDSGPYISSCPKRILDRLTPTDNVQANDWRARCRANLEKREEHRISNGDYIRYARPWSFGEYGQYDTFKVVVERHKIRFDAIDTARGIAAFRCTIKQYRKREFVKLTGDDIPQPPAPALGM